MPGSMDPVTYRQPRWDATLRPILGLCWSALVVALGVWGWAEKQYHWDLRSAFQLCFLALFVVVPWLGMRDDAHTITVSADGTCTFTSSRRDETIRAQQIRSIVDVDEGPILVNHDTGKISLTAIRDFEGLLDRLLQLNPAIELDDELTHRLERSRSKLLQAQ
jgi:hypothetical protein